MSILLSESQRRAIVAGAHCAVSFDDHTRQMYATDASIYQIVPTGVAFPRSAEEAQSVMKAAAEVGMPVIPRGAGTGLAGGAVGSGLVMDFSRHNRGITDLDLERRTVHVEPGVVLDQLNAYLLPHGYWFGPDVATSSRATLGGMIANDSSGAHSPVYGTTADHIVSLELLTADGQIATVDESDAPKHLREAVDAIAARYREEFERHFPGDLVKRWPGYDLARYLRNNRKFSHVICGSEGTLCTVLSATLRISPLPTRKALGLFYFASVAEAMQATVEFLDLEPAAIEHIDRALFDQTRHQIAFEPVRAMLRLDELPCESILIVELFDDIDDRLAALDSRHVGLRHEVVTDPARMAMVWGLRKAGLSLLTGRPGPSKPTAGIEDVAVRPHQLPAYVAGLQRLMAELGLEGSFYGHAASGLLHVRPVVDLHKREDIAKYRKLAQEASALTREFKGSIAAEHGVGIARTEFLPDHLSGEILEAMRLVKEAFDPKGLMNPGKITGGQFRIDTNLRWGASYEIPIAFEPVLEYHAKHESFIGNLEQCNGCGGCRKDAPTMCPTFIVTGDEIMSTRGRANTIRAVLDGRIPSSGDPLDSPALAKALDYCLSCKACTTECPSNVNMAMLKAELIHARHQHKGVSLADRVVASVDLLGKIGTMAPAIANRLMRTRRVRKWMQKLLGFSRKRTLPPYARERFDVWFRKHERRGAGMRGKVVLWDDTFVRYNEPHIGKAAVRVLEAAGFDVVLPKGRKCCGRPAFSTGQLDTARRLGEHNIALLKEIEPGSPIIFLEPSCYSMFVEDYLNLKIPGADAAAGRAILFETFIDRMLDSEPEALQFKTGYTWVAIHGHCHAKALGDAAVLPRLARRLPNSTVTMLNTACCGMAGAYGMQAAKYDMSRALAAPLVEQINALTAGTEVVATGTSCRHQIDDFTAVSPIHIAELIANAIAE